jgi:hypothetical protein
MPMQLTVEIRVQQLPEPGSRLPENYAILNKSFRYPITVDASILAASAAGAVETHIALSVDQTRQPGYGTLAAEFDLTTLARRFLDQAEELQGPALQRLAGLVAQADAAERQAPYGAITNNGIAQEE